MVVLSVYMKELGWLLKAMAFIIFWRQVLNLNLSKLHIDKDETVLLSALWHISSKDHTVETGEGFQEINAWRRRLDWQDVDWDTYINWLENLEKKEDMLKCWTTLLFFYVKSCRSDRHNRSLDYSLKKRIEKVIFNALT